MRSAPEKETAHAEELKEAEDSLALAKAAMPSYDTYLRLDKSEIPKLEAERKTIQAKLTETTQYLDQVRLIQFTLIVAQYCGK